MFLKNWFVYVDTQKYTANVKILPECVALRTSNVFLWVNQNDGCFWKTWTLQMKIFMIFYPSRLGRPIRSPSVFEIGILGCLRWVSNWHSCSSFEFHVRLIDYVFKAEKAKREHFHSCFGSALICRHDLFLVYDESQFRSIAAKTVVFVVGSRQLSLCEVCRIEKVQNAAKWVECLLDPK